MEDPDPAYVACLSEQLSQYRCPCADVEAAIVLGLNHDGCSRRECVSDEFPCPTGSQCLKGFCVSDDAASGGVNGGG
jgi:hypothetical protein